MRNPEAGSILDELRAGGFAALFNLDYEKARRDFRELARLFPDHPAGPQFLAASLWIETLYTTRKLQASLYGYVEVDQPLTAPAAAAAYRKKVEDVEARVKERMQRIRTIEEPYRQELLPAKYKACTLSPAVAA